jgi:hypothetical protein
MDSVLTVTPTDTTIRVGESAQLIPALVNADGQPIASFAIAYHATEPGIASVDPTGLVTGLAPGQTSIVGVVGGAEDTIAVSVPLSFADISAGLSTCGITSVSQPRCWGLNHKGELGSGTIGLPAPGPVTPTGGFSFILIHTSGGNDSTFTCGR